MNIRFKDARFPSLLHAQWAFFLEILAVEWTFRPLAVPLRDGREFRPDFFLPQQRYWLQAGQVEWSEHAYADWTRFVSAADTVVCEARENFLPGAICTRH